MHLIIYFIFYFFGVRVSSYGKGTEGGRGKFEEERQSWCRKFKFGSPSEGFFFFFLK